MENMTTPAVHHNDSYSDEDPDGGYDWDKLVQLERIVSAVIYGLVFVLGALGNGIVIWATGFRMKKTIDTVWFLNLAVADFLVTVFLPLKITEAALDYHWPFGRFICQMNAFVFYMNMYASIFTLVLISVDRCVCVKYPEWTRNHLHRTVRKASWVSLGVWVLALALSIPEFIFTDLYRDNESTNVICFEYAEEIYIQTSIEITTNFLVGFVVPFSIIVSCYSVIIHRYRNNPSLTSQSSRSFKIIAAIFAAFFLCWAPFHVIRLIMMFAVTGLIEFSNTLDLVLGFGLPMTLTLALVNSCLNPLLYMFSLGFKDVFRSRSIVNVLEKALDEEPPQTNNTRTDPDVTEETPLLEVVR